MQQYFSLLFLGLSRVGAALVKRGPVANGSENSKKSAFPTVIGVQRGRVGRRRSLPEVGTEPPGSAPQASADEKRSGADESCAEGRRKLHAGQTKVSGYS